MPAHETGNQQEIQIMPFNLRSRMKNGLMLPIETPSRPDLESILSKKFASTIPPIPGDLIKLALQRRTGPAVRRAVGMGQTTGFCRLSIWFMRSMKENRYGKNNNQLR